MAKEDDVGGLPFYVERKPTGLKSSTSPIPSRIHNILQEPNKYIPNKSAKLSNGQEVRNRALKEEASHVDKCQLKHIDRNVTTLVKEMDSEDNVKRERLADKLSGENKDYSLELISSCQKATENKELIDRKRAQELREAVHQKLKEVAQKKRQLQLIDNSVEVREMLTKYNRKAIARDQEFQIEEKRSMRKKEEELHSKWYGLLTNTIESLVTSSNQREEERVRREMKEAEIRQRQSLGEKNAKRLTDEIRAEDARYKDDVAAKMQEQVEKRRLDMNRSRIEIMSGIKDNIAYTKLKQDEKENEEKDMEEAYVKLAQEKLSLDMANKIGLKEECRADIELFQDYVKQRREEREQDEKLVEDLILRKSVVSDAKRSNIIKEIVQRKAKLAEEDLSLRKLQMDVCKEKEKAEQKALRDLCLFSSKCREISEKADNAVLEKRWMASKEFQAELLQQMKSEEKAKLRKAEEEYNRERAQKRLEIDDLDKVMELLKNSS